MTFTNMVTFWYGHECTHTWPIQVWGEHVFMHGTCSNVYICDVFEHWHMLVFTHLLICVTFPSTVICQHVQASSNMCHCQAESSNKWYRWILSHMWLNTYVYTRGVLRIVTYWYDVSECHHSILAWACVLIHGMFPSINIFHNGNVYSYMWCWWVPLLVCLVTFVHTHDVPSIVTCQHVILSTVTSSHIFIHMTFLF